MSNKSLTGFPVNSVALVVAYETESGIQEVIHQVDGKKNDILAVIHSVERKTKAVKDSDGTIIAYEPTGEEILIFKCKYISGSK